MRRVLKSSDEVFHFWANQTQSEGRAGNVFFRDSKVYSYGHHFCIARILPGGVAAFTTRSYSISTSRHIGGAHSATRHLRIVRCFDPSDDARANMDHARRSIADALHAAEKKGTRYTTRAAHKARALRIAENANAYLAALPEEERGTEFPIDTTALEGVRAELIRAEEAARKLREGQHAARLADLRADLERWRGGEIVMRTGLHELPPALRLGKSRGTYHTGGLLPDHGSEGSEVIQTSHGAEIPVSHARRFWPLVQVVRASGTPWTSPPEKSYPLGVYTLRTIRADGSIVVGCHDIAYAELARIAALLGLREEVAA